MPGFDHDEEPRTIRIKSDGTKDRFVDVKTEEMDGPKTEELANRPAKGSEETGLTDQDLFKGLKSIIPFLLEAEIPAHLSRDLNLEVSEDTPPFVTGVWEDAKGGGRSLLSQRKATSLRGAELPFCGLLGCYRPNTATVVVYTQGVDWVLSVMEQELLTTLPKSLSSRPLRELHVTDPTKLENALHTYLRWLVLDLTMVHMLGHAIVHLGLSNEAPWRSTMGFEALPLDLHEHLAQSLVATALTSKELAAPFPPSDLASVFARLSLSMRAECRAWARGLPWSGVEEIPKVIRSLREGHIPWQVFAV